MSNTVVAFEGVPGHPIAPDEHACVEHLLQTSALSEEQRQTIVASAIAMVEACRSQSHKAGTLDAFLQEFGLSNKEGIALMCLAEALLRVPDEETADRLIAEKLRSGDWSSHKGRSESAFVNASVWGLMLTGSIVSLDKSMTKDTGDWMRRLGARLGEPVIRAAVLQAMKIMGGQFVLGRTIKEALSRTHKAFKNGGRFSFDMLGEGARTAEDAERYFQSYRDAIAAIVEKRSGLGAIESDSISVKISALHPRYEERQSARVMGELYPKLLSLAEFAKLGGIGLSIDAEESERLQLSMRLFARLAKEPRLRGWNGLGFVLQAYQKRAVSVTNWLAKLAQQTGRTIPVRLVKGAYWDREIKHSQELGLSDYPVFTRKCHTDLSYQVCAESLLSYPELLYPQFATHNAHTIALILACAKPAQAFEFQRLHGMGHLLYETLGAQRPDVPVRVYAPVGQHRDFLPYLVRRLLENGANSSFVNRFLNAQVPPADLVQDPVVMTQMQAVYRHKKLPVPRALYANETHCWANASGLDPQDASHYPEFEQAIDRVRTHPVTAIPTTRVHAVHDNITSTPIVSPAEQTLEVGRVVEATIDDVDLAIARAVAAWPTWMRVSVDTRSQALEAAAEKLETQLFDWAALISLEAGRTLDDAVSEVREAVDFCRYYAQQGRRLFSQPLVLPGPTGETNRLVWQGRGAWVCISPWNFPLAIFIGQVAAALVAGNTVLAKPAEQTPLIAHKAVTLLHECGIPNEVLQLVPGDGAVVGKALVEDPRIAGVAFTGSTETAQGINRALAAKNGPIVPFIAETGGINCMIVDATALPEQVVDDVMVSAFQSAGQRCSALRVLYLQEDVADGIITMLRGALAEWRVGHPWHPESDMGPLIDEEAARQIRRHIEKLLQTETLLAKSPVTDTPRSGYYIEPHVFGISRLDQLKREVFGPVLHVISYKASEIEQVLQDINESGYGLTLGVHSRIDGFAQQVFANTRVGNTYVNRNIVGAVVGVNPFGGQGLSGTGPKAGGPNYLQRFALERTYTDNVVAKGGNTDLFTMADD